MTITNGGSSQPLVSPISGTAIVQAATQLRIIELDAVLDENISTSMNFAIDYTNQTFRMTGLQFTNWLNEALAITASNTAFDSTIFETYFADTPPDNVQDAIDFGLPILANADAGNIGKSTVTALTDADLVTNNSFNYLPAGASNAPDASNYSLLNITGNIPERNAQIVIQNSANFVNMHVRSSSSSGFCDWEKIATEVDLGAYLPLTGGTLTGDGDVLRLRQATVNASCYLRFQNSAGASLGFIGDASGGADNIGLFADIGDVDIDSATGDVDIRAPAGRIVLTPLSTIDANGKIQMGTANGKATIHSNLDINHSFHLTEDGRTIVGGLNNNVLLRPRGQGDATGETLFNPAGDIVASADITAFSGVAANAQPAIAATGQTTAYDLIELLLDKVDELETRLANAGIA